MAQESGQAKYAQLREYLREEILMGRVKPGEKIPSENELAERLSMSRHTVRKAISILVNEGFLYTEHGRGTFVMDRSVRRSESRNIGVITTYISEYIFPNVIQGIDRVLADKGYSIILKSTNNEPSREAQCLADMLGKNIEGLIIEPTKSALFTENLKYFQALDAQRIPYVFIHGHHPQLESKPEVLLNDEAGMRSVVTWLASLGHRRISGFFKADDVQGINRHKGYAKALAECALPYDPDLVVWYHTEDRDSKPAAALRAMLRLPQPIDAVACYNDQLAVRLLDELSAAGVKVPEDISVTGFDDSYLAAAARLTSMSHPKEKLGEAAAEWLMEMLDMETPPAGAPRVIEPELVIRESCRDRRAPKANNP